MRAPRYRLDAFYRHASQDEEIDALIKKCVRTKEDETGHEGGERKITFSFFTDAAATKAAKRIGKIRGVRVEIFDREAEDDPVYI